MIYDYLNFLPFLICFIVFVLYIIIASSLYRDLKKKKDSAFPIIKSFFVSSIYVLFAGMIANLILANTILDGEQGAFCFLYSMICLFLLFIGGNIFFLITVILH